jgi:tetratricopeptide (TPR) repeat protein
MQSQPRAWPVLSGTVPFPAEGYTPRPETGQGPWDALHPGLTVILGPDDDHGDSARVRGGTGKTQLAAAFARKLWAEAELDLLVWLDAGSRDRIMAGYARALADVRVAAPPGKPEAAASRFLTWLANTGRPWLVVLDGLADPADAEGLWPRGPSGQAVVTTMVSGLKPGSTAPGIAAWDEAPSVPESRSIALSAFSTREAMQYMSDRLDDPYQAAGSLDLAAILDCLPVGLSLAVAYLIDSGQDCRQYRLACERYWLDWSDRIAGDSLAPSWMLAVDRARQFAPAELAWPALRLAAVLGPAGIPGAVLISSAACAYVTGRQDVGKGDQGKLQAAFGNLEQVGLAAIEPEDEIRTVRMPAALQSSVRQLMGPAELRRAVYAAADAVYESWPAGGSQAEMVQALRDCATSIRRCDDLALWNPGCHALLVRVGQSLDDARMVETALAYWRDLAGISAEYHGTRSALTLQLRERLASAAEAAGRTNEAVSLREELAADMDEVAGPTHPQAITSRASLARGFRTAGRFREAISLGTRVAADSERVFGPAHAQATDSLLELGSAYRDAGQYPEAIGVFQRCLALRAQTTGLMDPDTRSARHQLADAYRHAGRGNEAIRLYHEALAQVENAVGATHPDAVAAREDLAIAYYHTGRPDDAAAIFEQALTEWQRVPGAAPAGTIAAKASLATIYCLNGRPKEAIPLYESELEDLERIRRPAHPDTFRARGNLAAAYHMAKRLPDAVELGEATLGDCEQILGPGYRETLTSRANLAHAYHATGLLKRASAHFDRALRDCGLALSVDDPLTGRVQALRKRYLSGRQGAAPIVTPPEQWGAWGSNPEPTD